MFLRRPYSARYDDAIADAVVVIVRDKGVQALTLRNVATFLGISPPALVNRYGSRDRVIAIALEVVSSRWRFDTERRWDRAQSRGRDHIAAITSLLPPTDEAEDLGVWMALVAHLGAAPTLRHLLSDVQRAERDLVAALLDADVVDLVVATVHGLRQAMSDTSHPLGRHEAEQALVHLLRLLGTPTDRAA